MNKIPTIFKRNWEGDRKVINEYTDGVTADLLNQCVATEKVDGTNVRITVRNGMVVRLEKRRNPTKLEKAKGIEDPWYVDADQYDPEDKWIYDSVKNTDISNVPDGEFSAEAYGKNVQGNPLGMPGNQLMIFSLQDHVVIFGDVPTKYEELKKFLQQRRTVIGESGTIEGIVWHHPDGRMYKIKAKDFPK